MMGIVLAQLFTDECTYASVVDAMLALHQCPRGQSGESDHKRNVNGGVLSRTRKCKHKQTH